MGNYTAHRQHAAVNKEIQKHCKQGIQMAANGKFEFSQPALMPIQLKWSFFCCYLIKNYVTLTRT
jgi:hypothetical protein